MKCQLKASAFLLGACLVAIAAKSANSQAVAYVYVAGSTLITGYTAASNGQLTPIPELPIAASVTHLSTNSKFLFGPGADNQNMYAFSINAGGVLLPGPVTYVQKYNTNGCPGTLGPTQISQSSLYLYSLVLDGDCAGNTVTHVYPILKSGNLGTGIGWYTQIEYAGSPQSIRLLGNDQFAFLTGCQHYGSDFTPTTLIYHTGNTVFPGGLVPDGQYHGAPAPSDPDDFYCPDMLASDPINHLAYAFRKYYPELAELSTPYYLASYTVDAQGNLTTSSNYSNMPAANIGTISTLSISPSGTLLAVAGTYGFELFKFDGGQPIVKIGSLVSSNPVTELGWDKAGHLYVLTTSSLYVYTATSSGVTQAPGSPYTLSDSGPYSMIALSLTH